VKDTGDRDLYRLVECRHGRFLVNPRDIYIGRSLLEYGEFSEAEWRLVAQLVRPGAVVVEAGANIGALTVPLARRLGRDGLLYAFEPQIPVFQLLCANLALNELLNVQALNAACGARPDRIGVRRIDPARPGNFGGVSLDQIAGGTGMRVPVERLDDALDPPRLDLIKADIEGMERELIEGARGLIARFRPLLYVEAHHAAHAPALIRLLGELDYRLWWHLPPLFNPGNHAGRSDNRFGGIVSLNMLGMPAERSTEVRGLRPVAGEDDHPTRWPGWGGRRPG
jgi:FkbM family methyltransferase